MPIMDLLPWRRSENKVPVKRTEPESDPFYSIQREMNQILDEFFGDGLRTFGSGDVSWNALNPRVNIVEGEKEIVVSAELPGVDSKDIDISYGNGVLTIKGEKREETEDQGKSYYRMERSYGSFTRSVPLPCEVNVDKVDATYRNGVLQVTLPKIIEAGECKRITVKSS